jgi:hypothetical protein
MPHRLVVKLVYACIQTLVMYLQACLTMATETGLTSMRDKALWHLALLLQEKGCIHAAVTKLRTAVKGMASQAELDSPELADCYKGNLVSLHLQMT